MTRASAAVRPVIASAAFGSTHRAPLELSRSHPSVMESVVRLSLALVFLSFALSAPLAAAQDRAAAPAPEPASETAKTPSETTYDFEDDVVTGDLVRPDGELLSVRRRGARHSLIRIRENFIPELLTSVEDL